MGLYVAAVFRSVRIRVHNWLVVKSLRHKWLRWLVVEDEPDWSKYE